MQFRTLLLLFSAVWVALAPTTSSAPASLGAPGTVIKAVTATVHVDKVVATKIESTTLFAVATESVTATATVTITTRPTATSGTETVTVTSTVTGQVLRRRQKSTSRRASATIGFESDATVTFTRTTTIVSEITSMSTRTVTRVTATVTRVGFMTTVTSTQTERPSNANVVVQTTTVWLTVAPPSPTGSVPSSSSGLSRTKKGAIAGGVLGFFALLGSIVAFHAVRKHWLRRAARCETPPIPLIPQPARPRRPKPAHKPWVPKPPSDMPEHSGPWMPGRLTVPSAKERV
ncbi:hypothetical protein EDC01DRAFT_630388 [Geopyxis carbonaria]|nr:hypothetical protein EDC01DRAFT_630388 [Geopyxis carbonaria]